MHISYVPTSFYALPDAMHGKKIIPLNTNN